MCNFGALNVEAIHIIKDRQPFCRVILLVDLLYFLFVFWLTSSDRPSRFPKSSAQASVQPPPWLPQPQPQQIRRRIKEKQTPSKFEINMINSLKEHVLEINENSIKRSRLNRSRAHVASRHQTSGMGSGRSSRFHREKVKETIEKELISLCSSFHEIWPLSDSYHQMNIQKSLNWGGSLVLDQVFSRLDLLERVSLMSLTESKYAHTPQATSPQRRSNSFSWWVISTNGIVQFQMLLQYFSNSGGWLKRIHLWSGPSRD